MRWRICVLGAAVLLVAGAAGDEKPAKDARKLTLATGYIFQRVAIDDGPFGAHTIGLDVALDEKGGKGMLNIDPNIQRYDAFGDDAGNTEIATRSVAITLSAVERDDPAKKGRRLFEITGEGLKGRLFLVVPGEKGGEHRLLVAEKEGTVKHVFPLRDTTKDR